MKTHNYFFLGAILLATGLNANAQSSSPDEAKAKTEMAAKAEADKAMKAWDAYMTPGPMHEMLAKDNGAWNEEITMWMTPGAPPQKSTANCTNEMIMDGRYQESKHTGDFGGMPFQGRSLVGYDNAKKVYQSTWIDNMGTGISFMEGPLDPKTNTVHFKGKMVDPMSGKELSVRQEWIMKDDNSRIMEMYMTGPDGKEFKSMEIKFTR